MTPLSLWRLGALAAPVLMTTLSLWRHSLLSWPRPPLRTYVRYVRTETLPRLIYKDLRGYQSAVNIGLPRCMVQYRKLRRSVSTILSIFGTSLRACWLACVWATCLAARSAFLDETWLRRASVRSSKALSSNDDKTQSLAVRPVQRISTYSRPWLGRVTQGA